MTSGDGVKERNEAQFMEENGEICSSKFNKNGDTISHYVELETEINSKNIEISALQDALNNIKSSLFLERKRVIDCSAENDILRIENYENRRKIGVLLRFCGKVDAEIVRLIDQEPQAMFSDLKIPPKFQQMATKSSSPKALRKTDDGAALEILALKEQLVQQEKCHSEHICSLLAERRNVSLERKEERIQFEHRIQQVSNSVIGGRNQVDDLIKEISELKANFKSTETELISQRERLLKKILFLQDYREGEIRESVKIPSVSSQERRTKEIYIIEIADLKLCLSKTLNQLQKTTEMLETSKKQFNNLKESTKKRLETANEQIMSLKSHCTELDKRRKNEVKGYQVDIELLRQKFRQIEHQMVKAAIGKNKEHEMIRKNRAYEKEISNLKKMLKSNVDWRT